MLCRHELPSGEWLWFIGQIFPTFTYFSPIWPSQWGRSPWAIGFIFGVGELEWLGYKCWRLHDDRLSRLGTIHQRDKHRQPRRHSRCRVKALRQIQRLKLLLRLMLLLCSQSMHLIPLSTRRNLSTRSKGRRIHVRLWLEVHRYQLPVGYV